MNRRDAWRGCYSPRMRALRLTLLCACVALAAVGCFRPALEFSPATLPDAQVGVPYSATITVSQASTPVGGASIQDGALPDGLDLAVAKDPIDTLQISGTPSTAGTFTFTVYVWCYGTNVNGQTATRQYTIAVR